MKTMLKYIKKISAGIIVGIANIIPGISGGTVAVIFGVYSDLVNIAAVNIKEIKKQWKDFLCLILGMGAGILIFARLFKILYQKFPVQINFFFVGLIVGSVFILAEFLKETSPVKKNTFIFKFLWFLIGLTLMAGLYFAQKYTGRSSSVLIQNINVKNFFILFFAGIAGALAMVIPGISGSFILLIMGVYNSVINAVTEFNFPVLFIVGTGVLIGIVAAGRFISYFLQKYSKTTYAFILGLVLGSVMHIYPQVCQSFNMRVISAVCIFAGYSIITVFDRIKTKA